MPSVRNCQRQIWRHTITRFSRNAYDHAVIRALLMHLGVTLRSVNEPITDDPVGRLTENLLAAIGQVDNGQKAERTKAECVRWRTT